jgi:hypothetical protein
MVVSEWMANYHKSNGKLRQALVFHLDGTDDDVCPEGLE